MSEKLNIILNGKNITGNKGETILQLANRHGVSIPTLCHDPRLEPYSSCFVCVVEVKNMRGLQPACSTRINEGMEIETENDKVRKARKTALDLLVSNHYADCLGPCKQTCPAGVDVQGYISFIEKGMYSEAVALIKETNPLPAICGRVCVRPCEVACRRNLLDEGAAVGIDYLKRFAADRDLESPNKFVPEVKETTGKKVAVIGAGPGGLSSAFFLRKEGHAVDIFEGAPQAGGWLRYGIPEYRLPNDILQKEVDNITDLGVNIFYNKKLGDNIRFKELKDNYDAFVLAIGSQKGTLVGCEGDDAGNVFSGIDFLKEMELSGKRYDFSGKTVAVVGGGNTAMDCCRSAFRCGAKKVYVIYRRTEKEMPANPIEIHESKLEGVEYLFLTNPKKVNAHEDGNVKSVTLLRMELGEPDASGRRRPVPVEGSDFDLEVDYILAAIGQKTVVNFLDDINETVNGAGELKLNRWGDIDAQAETLQTGIPNVFAAGDGVTGPATLIEAVAQARIASLSAHQMLSGQPIKAEKKEFVSMRDNFKDQLGEEYKGAFAEQKREEMPTLDPDARNNFDEVELGYDNEEVAMHETSRCLECGCTEFFECDLKNHCTEYGAEQKAEGEFKQYDVDFRHPFVEIDNNKCILCSRCVRICDEVVGASALGLINRGFDTYVAPSMGDCLSDTPCESCGLCISACPTGAITENVNFKPGPVKLDSFKTICNYCSVGCEIEVHHKKGFVMKVTGAEGKVNAKGNLCRFPKFGYNYFNRKDRITTPMLKENGEFKPVSFEKAFELIAQKAKAVEADANAVFAGARLSNEEMYMAQKWTRAGLKTNNVGSFHYVGIGHKHHEITKDNVSLNELKDASKIWLIGSEINKDNAVAGFMVNNAKKTKGIAVDLITTLTDSAMKRKVDNVMEVKNYYYFLRAVNYYILSNGLENGLFINDRTEGYEAYKEELLKEDLKALVEKGSCCEECLVDFAKEFNKEMNAVIVFSEKEMSANAMVEIRNLALITGKLGKTASGIMALKEKNNSHGLIDMGVCPRIGVGSQDITNEDFLKKLESKWNISDLSRETKCLFPTLEAGKIKNMFIFGEDPVGCSLDAELVEKWFTGANFVVVQDYFMTETAKKADLILPASFSAELDGSFSNTQKNIQEFKAGLESKLEMNAQQQWIELLKKEGMNGIEHAGDAFLEAASLLPQENNSTYSFVNTAKDNHNRLFDYGCDYLVKDFEEYFKASFSD